MIAELMAARQRRHRESSRDPSPWLRGGSKHRTSHQEPAAPDPSSFVQQISRRCRPDQCIRPRCSVPRHTQLSPALATRWLNPGHQHNGNQTGQSKAEVTWWVLVAREIQITRKQ